MSDGREQFARATQTRSEAERTFTNREQLTDTVTVPANSTETVSWPIFEKYKPIHIAAAPSGPDDPSGLHWEALITGVDSWRVYGIGGEGVTFHDLKTAPLGETDPDIDITNITDSSIEVRASMYILRDDGGTEQFLI